MSLDNTRLQHQLEVYKGLVEVSALINGITESAELLPAILEVARRVMDVEAASLFLVDSSGSLDLAIASMADGRSGPPPQRVVVPRGRGISGWVLEHGQSLLVPDAYSDARFYRETDRQTGFRTRSILCVPLSRHGKEIGVLQVLNPVGRKAFDIAISPPLRRTETWRQPRSTSFARSSEDVSSSASTRSYPSRGIFRRAFSRVLSQSAMT
jgi:sigma-B regulation protein RsbU (phosphoserine phosphatase)